MFKFFRKFNIFRVFYRVEEINGICFVYRTNTGLGFGGSEMVFSTPELSDAREWITKDKSKRKITVVHEE